MAYIDDEKIAEIRNALAIISGQAQILLEVKLGNRKSLEEITNQVIRIDNLLPAIKYEKERKCHATE